MRSVACDPALFGDGLFRINENYKILPGPQLWALQESSIDHQHSVQFSNVEIKRKWNIANQIKRGRTVMAIPAFPQWLQQQSNNCVQVTSVVVVAFC